MDLRYRIDVVGEVAVLALLGEADVSTLPQLHEHVRRFVNDHPGRLVVVDLDGLGHLDPLATGVLVAGRLMARAGGGDLAVVGTSAAVTRVFTGSDLDATFPLHASIAQAAAVEGRHQPL